MIFKNALWRTSHGADASPPDMNPNQSPHPHPSETSPPQNPGASSRRWQRATWVFAVPAGIFVLLYVSLFCEQYALMRKTLDDAVRNGAANQQSSPTQATTTLATAAANSGNSPVKPSRWFSLGTPAGWQPPTDSAHVWPTESLPGRFWKSPLEIAHPEQVEPDPFAPKPAPLEEATPLSAPAPKPIHDWSLTFGTWGFGWVDFGKATVIRCGPWQGWCRFYLDEIVLVLAVTMGLLAGLCHTCRSHTPQVSFWSRAWAPTIVLLLLSLAACLAWRWEMEWAYEVKKVEWLNHFFWAVPAAVAAFIGWAVWAASVQRRWLLMAALVVLAGGSAWIARQAILECTMFERTRLLWWDPTIMRDHLIRVYHAQYLATLMWAAIPVLFALTCRGFGARISWLRAGFSAALFVLSWPLAMIAALFFELIPHDDPIQVLKSGTAIPFLIFSLGLPLLGTHRRQA